MEMELIPQFRVQMPQIMRNSNSLVGVVRVSPSSGETFPVSSSRWKSLEVRHDDGQCIRQPAVSTSDGMKLPELSFNRLQPSDQEYGELQRHNFGRFVAREAVLDEEYWTAAWLRAEAHWESVSYMRHIDNYKRKYAEQEFYALKRRCTGQDGNSLKCYCLVALKREERNIRRTVLNSVVGTLDLSIRQFLHGETYPREKSRTTAVLASQDPFGAHRYAYIANVCVSKFARRQGIASNLLHLAIDIATSAGMQQLYVHVNADNKAAQQLYTKSGFEIFEAASSTLAKDQRLLMLNRNNNLTVELSVLIGFDLYPFRLNVLCHVCDLFVVVRRSARDVSVL
ncbi:hypothetical protein Nepgr_025782 [Nepenthes gracilis]|uniref:N-acetyltransferase domain-containing protein n=1 Tax=Nepenthes gracilis TaxID=150966 RepID=A0AAD3Y1E2_NEPGR|nr:hypothetical protein Nepgr_025782 [Nepenthes gracilis]